MGRTEPLRPRHARRVHWFERAAFRVSPRRPYLGPDDFVTAQVPVLGDAVHPVAGDETASSSTTARATSSTRIPSCSLTISCIVTVGHDEYWSWEMRDNVEQFAANGGTVVVLSGNSVWWQIRFDESRRSRATRTGLDPASGDPAMRSRVTVNWIDPSSAVPRR